MIKYPDNKEEIQADGTPTESDNQVWTAEDTSGQIIADLEDQLKIQKLISEISAKFVNLQTAQVNRQIEERLKLLVEFLGVDRSTFFRISKDRKDLIPIDSHTMKNGRKERKNNQDELRYFNLMKFDNF